MTDRIPGESKLPASVECCADWRPQCEKINAPIVLQSIRSGMEWQYDGIPFRFCPWCGRKRVEPQT